MRRLQLVLLAGLLALAAGCGGGSIGPTPTPTPPPSKVDATIQIASTTTGRLDLAMSTSFQPAEWDYQLFTNFPAATTPLGNLESQHIRLQPISQGVPQKADQSWDFTVLDAIFNPVVSVADKSPELQIATAPLWMDDANGNLLPAHYSDFAAYSANLVKYYNTGGFQDSHGGTHVHSPSTPITYWGIFNEPNVNGLSAMQYTQLYNLTVPAMQAADSTLKYVAVELADFSSEEQKMLPTFVSGVNAQVDIVATHFYSTCNQKDSDLQLFSTVPGFASGVQYIYSELAAKPALANVPVWITENNVNADYDKGNGISACNGTAFVRDNRGSSAFFAAWRPLVFARLGKVGAHALYHWDFAADAEFGEFDDTTGKPRLSYWVDYWLARMFPSPPGANILQFTNSDNNEVEVLAVRNPDNSVVVMVANYAVAAASDNNGPGAPRNISIDTSALGTFSNASLLVIDAATDTANGPSPTTISTASPIQITLNGYGVAFIKLN